MKKLFLLATTLPVFLIMTGCGKDENNDPPADQPANITITEPTAGVTYINGSTIMVRGNVTDNNVLASARIEIKNNSTNAVMYQQNQSTGNVTYFDLNWNWTVAGISSTVNATIKIIVTDKAGYQASKEIAIVLTD
ncbi:MAG: hypothetical protein JNK27_12690 [Chitinophagaceae bacterium]|nr:hypothetical protein [Chitinophagaceae bacterium]